MITIKLSESYGCKSAEEVMDGINQLEKLGFSDDEINQILLRSKTGEKLTPTKGGENNE